MSPNLLKRDLLITLKAMASVVIISSINLRHCLFLDLSHWMDIEKAHIADHLKSTTNSILVIPPFLRRSAFKETTLLLLVLVLLLGHPCFLVILLRSKF
ncbi:hypothetical protein CPB84DRAFT_1773176 [Gymnopilus junonius]|uniref:Transmembrane protein n=1 Tax=Gymnopilus junonius TaxID=109634 RepID=A0A9P5NPX7_GYMJU|nr:hypothetical protein CPB84DRAFT_1773176 [Gymnopilus junonius]